jgi:iron complex transport system ATP-binding protein
MSITGLRRHAIAAPVRAERGEAVLTIRGLGVSRRGRDVVSDVDIVVRAGEVVALVGPNGAGKSSLLGAIAGDLQSTGVIEIDGRPAEAWSPAELALRRAVLPQQVAVAFPFLAREVVTMGRAPWRAFDDGEDKARVAAALAEVDALALADRRVTNLSGGERARVALARVLVQRAQLLLLDEPTAALDLGHQELVMRVVRGRAAAGDAVVVVLHDLSLAAAHADRVVVLHHGRVVADGAPGEVCRPDLLRHVYRAPIEVLPHPRSGIPIVVPERGRSVREDLHVE